ncbi:MAG: class II aldolase/adducin family protein, partial [Candidatus Brocadiales bacterium]
MLKEFRRIGRQLFHLGLITSHGGNLSLRKGGDIFITRHSAMLGDLQKGDVVKVSTKRGSAKPAEVSKEYPVHKKIYDMTGAGAVIHAHPPNAIALSLVKKTIQPLDAEGIILLGEIPVITARKVVGSKEVGEKLAKALMKAPVAMVKGHGSFAVGKTLEEAIC